MKINDFYKNEDSPENELDDVINIMNSNNRQEVQPPSQELDVPKYDVKDNNYLREGIEKKQEEKQGNEDDYLNYEENLKNLQKIDEEQAKFDVFTTDLDSCFNSFRKMLNDPPPPPDIQNIGPSSTFTREIPTVDPEIILHGEEENERNLYQELGLPKPPPEMPTLSTNNEPNPVSYPNPISYPNPPLSNINP
jgi:hypothetical protein